MIGSVLFWIGCILALIGASFNASGRKNSYIILNTANVINIFGAAIDAQWHLFFMFFGFLIINTIGYFYWKVKRIGV